MTPLAVDLFNFRTYRGHHRITIPNGLTTLLGRIEGGPDGTDSNGAGKSSILLALDVALFGAEGRSLAEYVTHGETEMSVMLTFEHRGVTYRVRRGFSTRGAGKPSCDFERMAAS